MLSGDMKSLTADLKQMFYRDQAESMKVIEEEQASKSVKSKRNKKKKRRRHRKRKKAVDASKENDNCSEPIIEDESPGSRTDKESSIISKPRKDPVVDLQPVDPDKIILNSIFAKCGKLQEADEVSRHRNAKRLENTFIDGPVDPNHQTILILENQQKEHMRKVQISENQDEVQTFALDSSDSFVLEIIDQKKSNTRDST